MRNKYYYGKKISDYGLERGFVDLNTFSEVMFYSAENYRFRT